jgi:predicted RNA methylase
MGAEPRPSDAFVLSFLADDPPTDLAFDEFLAPAHRDRSELFWTPVAVAHRAAHWLAEAGAREVVDVGSGAGKFCVVAALSSPNLRLVGIEHRASLVWAARVLAARFGLGRRASFVHTTIEHPRLAMFDAVYLFNPFGENLHAVEGRLDESVELTPERMRRDVRLVEHVFEKLLIGSRVVTYFGFGGRVPDSFVVEREELAGSDVLRMWIKRRHASRGRVWRETDGGVELCDARLGEGGT